MCSIPESPFPIIYTERLFLRAFDPSLPSDYDAALSLYGSEYALRTFGDRGLHTNEDVDARCAKLRPRPPASTPFPSHPLHLIYLRDSPDTLVGLTSLFHRHPLPYPDLGYFINEPYINNGYATEAGKAALKWWTEEMHVETIWAGIFDTHYGSQRVAEKIGFVEGGVITFVLSETEVREGRAFVQPKMGRCMDGLMVDVRKK